MIRGGCSDDPAILGPNPVVTAHIHTLQFDPRRAGLGVHQPQPVPLPDDEAPTRSPSRDVPCGVEPDPPRPTGVWLQTPEDELMSPVEIEIGLKKYPRVVADESGAVEGLSIAPRWQPGQEPAAGDVPDDARDPPRVDPSRWPQAPAIGREGRRRPRGWPFP